MAARAPLLRLPKATTSILDHTPLISRRLAHQRRAHPTKSTSSSIIRPLSSGAARRSYNYNNYQNGNPYIPSIQPPPPPPARPSRWTLFFRAVNTLSGLAAVYLLFCLCESVEYTLGVLTSLEQNYWRDHVERQLRRVREDRGAAAGGDEPVAAAADPRDELYERMLLRKRREARDEFVEFMQQVEQGR